MSLGPRTQGFYELRAKGGAAAVTVSELVVHPETDGSHMLHLNLTTPGNLASHTYTADAIRRHGATNDIGSVIDGEEAVACGLIDAVGGVGDALGELRRLCYGTDRAKGAQGE